MLSEDFSIYMNRASEPKLTATDGSIQEPEAVLAGFHAKIWPWLPITIRFLLARNAMDRLNGHWSSLTHG